MESTKIILRGTDKVHLLIKMHSHYNWDKTQLSLAAFPSPPPPRLRLVGLVTVCMQLKAASPTCLDLGEAEEKGIFLPNENTALNLEKNAWVNQKQIKGQFQVVLQGFLKLSDCIL